MHPVTKLTGIKVMEKAVEESKTDIGGRHSLKQLTEMSITGPSEVSARRVLTGVDMEARKDVASKYDEDARRRHSTDGLRTGCFHCIRKCARGIVIKDGR